MAVERKTVTMNDEAWIEACQQILHFGHVTVNYGNADVTLHICYIDGCPEAEEGTTVG